MVDDYNFQGPISPDASELMDTNFIGDSFEKQVAYE